MFVATIDAIAAIASLTFSFIVLALAFVGFSVIIYTMMNRDGYSFRRAVSECFDSSISVMKKVLDI